MANDQNPVPVLATVRVDQPEVNTDTRAPDGYAIGYGKPPVHSRFSKGRSGNPGGRPKGRKNLATALEKELQTRVTITENGRRRTITKLEATVKHLVNKAATGDQRAMVFLLNLAQSGLVNEQVVAPLSSEADEQVKRALMERISKISQESGNES
jgi:hypothetical protein